ncbi:alpha/beta hydrolase [Litchfieldia alkalitelluris]|uniref:alpha/beta hydrolase n=1 Tax=Litchfieldia alkalitelluris TaxID=304268 RepID=UPI000996571F|nr:alpha/beta hydrolase [Litchfieldia alkalitelluris]
MRVVSKQYEELVCLVEARSEVKHESGIVKVIKHIPDVDISGDLDPRVLANVIKQHEAHAGNSMPDFSSIKPENFPIALRSAMGWPNKDVTKTEITTTYSEINGENGSIPIRIYSPESIDFLPVVVFFHGGGFIGGTVGAVENSCKALAEKANLVVISVDYRLAPEHPFPAGLIDCFDAVTWVYEHAGELGVNRDQIAVCGDSAGGNLATVCALMDREKGKNMIKFQALIYPVVNLGKNSTEDFKWNLDQYVIEHHHEIIKGTVLALGEAGVLFNNLYLQGRAEISNPQVSPLFAENLSGMPETLMITAEYDYLRLEAEAYTRKLLRSGVKTKHIQYNGMDHAFIDKIGEYPQAEDCMNEIAKGLKAVFGR